MKLNIHGPVQAIPGWTIILLISVSLSCSKDDDPKVDIETQPAEVSFVDVNTCQSPFGGSLHTNFFFTIPYKTASPDVKIQKIHYSVSVAGKAVGEKDDYTFNDTGTEIIFSICIRFAGAPEIDVTSTLISTDGRQSNSSTVKIDKPAGAN
jgi:hypothetical protein